MQRGAGGVQRTVRNPPQLDANTCSHGTLRYATMYTKYGLQGLARWRSTSVASAVDGCWSHSIDCS